MRVFFFNFVREFFAKKLLHLLQSNSTRFMMELGYSGINTCPVNSEKSIYLFRDYTCLEVVRSRQEMRVTTWSGIAIGKTPR